MTEFKLHDVSSAPEASRPTLGAIEKAWGFVPNLHRVLAEAPAALEGYATLFGIFDKTSFSPAERQVVYLTANYENECQYCMAGHSVLAKMAHLPEQAIQALRDGRPIEDKKLEAPQSSTSL
jgi:AhpD family alkylhydroperoxidase